jgi:hypothetical protein
MTTEAKLPAIKPTNFIRTLVYECDPDSFGRVLEIQIYTDGIEFRITQPGTDSIEYFYSGNPNSFLRCLESETSP